MNTAPRQPLEERDARIAALEEIITDYHRALLTVKIAIRNGFPPVEKLLPLIEKTLQQGAESKGE